MNVSSASARVHYLDAVRAFALLLGIVFHASLSFQPMFIGWAVMDVSTSALVSVFALVSHSFRMELFFLIAGFFAHLTFHANGAGTFLKSRTVRLLVPFVVGWFLLRPLLVSGWIMGATSLRGEVDIGAGLRGGFQSLGALPQGLFTGTHLWFLYYLVLVTVAFLAIRAMIVAIDPWRAWLTARTEAVFARFAGSRFALLWVAVPTAAVLWFMQRWGVDTPDKTLRPHFPVLLLYGGFFACGWMLRRKPALLSPLVRVTPLRVMFAVAGVAGALLLAGFQGNPGHPHVTAARVGFNLSYAVMMWSLVLLTVGVFQKLLGRPSRVVRYVADASYWMYLVHLPIVVWLQVAVAELPLHWSFKLAGISAATILVALISYDLFVRSTVIGRILNGRRRPRAIFRMRSAATVAGLGSAVPTSIRSDA